MKKDPKSKGRRMAPRHDEETIAQALIALSLESGNTRHAAARLRQAGKKVAHQTISKWREKYPEKYEAVSREVLPKVREHAAEKQMDVAEEARRVELKLMQRLDAEVDQLPLRDVSSSARNSAVQQGIHIQRAAELRGDIQPVAVDVSLVGLVRSIGETNAFFDERGKRLTTDEAIEKAKGESIEGQATEVEAAQPTSPQTNGKG